MTPSATADFTRWLDALPVERLTALLRLRPDALVPPPPSTASLATRLLSRTSVARAMQEASVPELAALEVAVDAGAALTPVDSGRILADLSARGGPDLSDPGPKALSRLIDRGLVFEVDGGLRVVAEAIPALPRGWTLLDRSASDGLKQALNELTDAERRVLFVLASADGVGHSRDAAADADPARPIPRLLAAGLIERVDASHVRLPRVVAQLVRGDDAPDVPISAPAPGEPVDFSAAEAHGAAQGVEFTRAVTRLLDHLGAHPVALNKDGSLGIRVPSTLAKAVGCTVEDVVRFACVAEAAGLLATGLAANVPEGLDADGNYLAPTAATDSFVHAPLAEQWSWLIQGWARSPHQHYLGGRLLSAQQRSAALPGRRRQLLDAILRAGGAVDDERAKDWVRYLYPLSAVELGAEGISALLTEARCLGVISLGVATSAARAVIDGDVDALAEAVAGALPAEVTKVIVQADMTVIAPGPLPTEVAEELGLLADIESPGLAATYRITEDSVRRALDAGRSAADLHGWLADHALGEVPQAVRFIIDDVADRHGALRGGPAMSYLRCPDEALLGAVMASSAASEAGLRLVAPTVAIAHRPLAAVLECVRKAGFHPAAEDSSGATIDVRPDPTRVFARSQRPALPRCAPEEAAIERVVSDVRRNNDAPGDVTADPAQAREGDVAATLSAAARARRPVEVGVVDARGVSTTIEVTPVTVAGGQVDAIETTSKRVIRLPVHRVSWARAR
ncbi:helicase-associated domain-containing protein [Corynebacterium uterequi]|uniref:Helicase conserved C-terminal domain n=1 Tax=Corynebacterium uterequi TaxID=1072256 RepID=A0A0G3HBK9_9CORY|nr:helicase-associated domain-containing protein [Corynebacterium uterequi]AKK10639.1 Helicase conserved C-terminal domain [Corynebacterium uterequi]